MDLQINPLTKPDGFLEDLGELKTETADIEQSLIDECEKLAEETGMIHFLFDTDTSLKIKKLKITDKIDINDDVYEIGTEYNFREMPSRFSYYDTETKLTCRYKKHNLASEWFKQIGFIPSIYNYGAEYENSFTLDLENNNKLIIRLQPNLIIKVIHASNILNLVIYSGFFSKMNILHSIIKELPELISIARDLKLDIMFDNEKESL
jgi:hypothetical protein